MKPWTVLAELRVDLPREELRAYVRAQPVDRQVHPGLRAGTTVPVKDFSVGSYADDLIRFQQRNLTPGEHDAGNQNFVADFQSSGKPTGSAGGLAKFDGPGSCL